MWLTGWLQFGRLTAALLVLLAGLPLAVVAGPQDSQGPSDNIAGPQISVRKPPIHTTPIQVDVNLVLLNVTITDPYDRVVTGLERDNFRVFDEKAEQQIVSFSTEDTPISVGLIFDSSGSLQRKVQSCFRLYFEV